MRTAQARSWVAMDKHFKPCPSPIQDNTLWPGGHL